MKIKQMVIAASVAIAGLAAAGSAFAQVYVEAPNAPPPPRYEAVPGPRVGYAWDNGHWRWAHGRYVWVRGHWQPVVAGRHWVPGHWDRRGPVWRWMPGHWN